MWRLDLQSLHKEIGMFELCEGKLFKGSKIATTPFYALLPHGFIPKLLHNSYSNCNKNL